MNKIKIVKEALLILAHIALIGLWVEVLASQTGVMFFIFLPLYMLCVALTMYSTYHATHSVIRIWKEVFYE